MTLIKRLKSMPLMLRLLMIFIATAFSLMFLISGAFRFIAQENQHRWRGFENIFADYSASLVERIGSTSDLALAKKLANELRLNITIIEKGKNWSSHPDQEEHQLDVLQGLNFKKSEITNAEYAHRRGIFYIRISSKLESNKKEQNKLGLNKIASDIKDQKLQGLISENIKQVYISKRRDFSDFTIPFRAYMVFLLMVVVMYLSYRAIKNMFSPIQDLQVGSLNFTKGDLQYRIPIKRDDELGRLTEVMNNMAEQIEKMLQAKRQMLLAISHELRTPLTRMKLATELMDENAQQATLRRDIQEMETLISEILESERLNSSHKVLNLEPIQLPELIHELVMELNQSCNDRVICKGVINDADKEREFPILQLDPLRMRLLMRNLISNALQHSDNQVEVLIKVENKSVCISVQDTGAGIAPEHIQYLTQAFYRVDDARLRKTGGFGLGLYLCQLIVQAHGGELNISSEVDKGTCVTVELEIDAE
ncbi:MAG: HAMP domain-containing sensor histidine kinase [Bermanella sp.]